MRTWRIVKTWEDSPAGAPTLDRVRVQGYDVAEAACEALKVLGYGVSVCCDDIGPKCPTCARESYAAHQAEDDAVDRERERRDTLGVVHAMFSGPLPQADAGEPYDYPDPPR